MKQMNCTEKMCADKVVRSCETLDNMTCHPIGKWGRMHRDYLKSVHPDLYRQLLQNGTLSKEMADVHERAYNLLDQLIQQMASREHITEQLKASDQNGVGAPHEQHPQSSRGNCKGRSYPYVVTNTSAPFR